jgi:hypothetical protein
MPELDFEIVGVGVEPNSMTPSLRFALSATVRQNSDPVQSVSLQCQLRIDPVRRAYEDAECEGLRDLFGERARWGETLRSFLWQQVTASVPAFANETRFDLVVPCSFDFNIAATKYFHGLKDGFVPLTFLFSGSIFYRDSADRLQICQISHGKEASYRLPVRVWQTMMDHYYPDCAWLPLSRETFEKLYRLKQLNGIASFEQTLEQLLRSATPEIAQ